MLFNFSPRFIGILFIYFCAIFQSFGQIGLQAILQIVLEQWWSSDSSTTIVNLFICAYLLSGVVGGLLADRFGVRGSFFVGVAGALIWVVGSALAVFPKHPSLDWPTLIIAMSLTAIGYGVINPTQVVFCGCQFDSEKESEAADSAIAFLYFSYNVGNLAGESVAPVLRQSYGIYPPMMALFLSVSFGSLLFLIGSPFYRNALRKTQSTIANSNNSKIIQYDNDNVEYNQNERLLNDGNEKKSSTSASSSPPPLSLSQVLLVVAPIPIFYAVLWQQNTTMVSQGQLLKRRLPLTHYDIPPDLMSGLEDWFLLFVIPLLDKLIYKRVRWLRDVRAIKSDSIHEPDSLNNSQHLLARMFCGIISGSIAMISCALLSWLFVKNETTILLQLPALLLLSVSEAMVAISGLQLVVGEARLRGATQTATCTAIWLAFGSIGALLGAGVSRLNLPAVPAFLLWAAVSFASSIGLFIAYRRCQSSD